MQQKFQRSLECHIWRKANFQSEALAGYESWNLLWFYFSCHGLNLRRKIRVTALVRHQLRFLSRISAKIFVSTRPRVEMMSSKSHVRACQRKKWIVGKEQDVAFDFGWWRIVVKLCKAWCEITMRDNSSGENMPTDYVGSSNVYNLTRLEV